MEGFNGELSMDNPEYVQLINKRTDELLKKIQEGRAELKKRKKEEKKEKKEKFIRYLSYFGLDLDHYGPPSIDNKRKNNPNARIGACYKKAHVELTNAQIGDDNLSPNSPISSPNIHQVGK